MPEIIKPSRVVRSDEIVIIPDIALPEPEEEIDDTPQEEQEEEKPDDSVQREIEAMQQMARQLLEAAGAERDEILRQAQDHAARVLEEARAEGYEAGRQSAANNIKALLGEARTLLDEMQERQDEYFVQYQNELRFLSLDIARKIIGDVIKTRESDFAELVRQAVSTIKGAEWITVELSGRLGELIKLLSAEFAGKPHAGHIQVVPAEMPDDGCVITTDTGSIDVSVSTQLDNLRELFRSMDDL